MTTERPIGVSNALTNLRPGSKWLIRNGVYEGLEWLDEEQECPTKEEIETEIARLQAQKEATEYQRLRAAEYPDFKEYLDGIVKGDEAQVQAYIEACKAVKEKYPKPVVGVATT